MATSLRAAIQYGMIRKYAPQAYVLHLVFLDILNNTVEDNYVKQTVRERLGRRISEELLKVGEPGQKSIKDQIMGISRNFAELARSNKSKVNPALEQLQYSDFNLTMRLSRDRFGDFAPAAMLKEPYLLVIDDMLTNPKTLGMIQQAYLECIKNLEADKLCFIEKDFGPTGTLLLASYLTSESGLPSIVYRQRRWPMGSILQGSLEKTKTQEIDKICIVYDLCVTGGAIEEAANFIESKLKETKVTDSVVFYDYKREGVKERLTKRGIQLHSILDKEKINLEYVRNSLIAKHQKLIADLISQFNEKKLSYQSFLKKSIKPVIENAKLSKALIK
jgi:orotate phosphoribosyltransferase